MNKRKQELLESNQELEEILNKTRATNEAEAVEIDTYEQKNQEDEDKLRQLHKEADRVVKIGEAYKTERRGIKDTLVNICNCTDEHALFNNDSL
jgi:hypothetical protein